MCQSAVDNAKASECTNAMDVKIVDDAFSAKKRTPSLRTMYRFADSMDALLLAIGTFFVVLSGCNQPLQLVVFGQLMDSFNLTTKAAVKDRVHLLAGLYASLGLMQMVTNSIQTSCFSTVAARQAQRIRLAHFKALARKPLAYFDQPEQDAGALASSVMDKSLQVQTGIGDDLVQLMVRVLQFVFGVGAAVYFCWPLALVSLAAVPMLAVVVGLANKAYANATRDSASLLDLATALPLEAIGAIRTVHAYGREASILERYRSTCKDARAQGLALGRARAGLEGATAPIMFVMFGGCLWFGSSLVASDMEQYDYCRFVNLTASGPVLQDPDPLRCTTGGGVLTAFLSVVFGFMGMLQALPSISSLAAAKASAAAIFEVLDAKPEAIDALADEGSGEKRADGLIELRDVSFAYPARKEVSVYSGLSLTINAGQVVALAGPSGCGKSTLVALLERWYDVDGGSLLLDGQDVRSVSVRWLRAQIGLVSQEPVLFSGSIGWNIGLGGAASSGADGMACVAEDDASVVQAARLANAHEFVSAMPGGYATQVGEKGIQLSGGQKQRIAIARALVREPAVLVLDEATSALDAASERVVQAALDEIMTKQRRTTIIIAHRLSTIRNADKICVISGGKVVEEGAHDELLAASHGIYRALVDAQTSSPPSSSKAASAVDPSIEAVPTTAEALSPAAFSVPAGVDIDPASIPISVADAVKVGFSDVTEAMEETVGEATGAGTVVGVADIVHSSTKGAQSSEDGSAATAQSPVDEEQRKRAEKADKAETARRNKAARRWLWKQSAPEMPYLLLGLVGAVVTGLAMPAIGLLMAEFVAVFYNVDIEQMRSDARKWGLVFLGMGAVNAIGAVVRQICFATVTEHMVLRVRCAAFESILRQPVGWFDASSDHTAGALANRLAADCYLIKALTGERASIAISQIAVLIAGMSVSLSSSALLTVCTLGIIPLICVPVVIQAKVVMKFAERATASTVAAGQTASETLLQLRTVAAFGLEASRIEHFGRELTMPFKQDVRKGIALGIGTGVAAGSILLGAAFQYFVGGLFYDADLVDFPNIMRCLLVLIFMAFGFTAVSRDASDRAEALLAGRRVHTLVTTESPIDALGEQTTAAAGGGDKRAGVAVPSRADGLIELRDVSFAYPARKEVSVYSGLSLTINAGQVVALAGPSGCGKSTLVALLERWYDVDGGSLLLDGQDVRSVSVRWLRAQIGLVSQEPVLFSGSIGWNIGLGGAASSGADGMACVAEDDASVVQAARLANAHEFVSAMPGGYATQVGEKGIQLSGGQKQRIAIARALVREPAVLVLDEATSALDAASERVVQAALDEIMTKQRRTTIIIAHRLSTIRNADKICVISGGKVVEEGAHDELLAASHGIYRALVAHSEGASTPE